MQKLATRNNRAKDAIWCQQQCTVVAPSSSAKENLMKTDDNELDNEGKKIYPSYYCVRGIPVCKLNMYRNCCAPQTRFFS